MAATATQPQYVDEQERSSDETKTKPADNESKPVDDAVNKLAQDSGAESERKSSVEFGQEKPDAIRYHSTQDFGGNEVEVITIYCRSRKTMKKTAGGTTGVAATAGAAALMFGTGVITGGLATVPVALTTIGVGGASYVAGGAVTGYLVNPRVMRFDFLNYDEANEAFRQISTYKIMIRNGVVVQSMGKMRWVAELVGSAITDSSEQGPGLSLNSIPEPDQAFNIIRSPMTYGASKMRVKPWQKFNIKQYTTDYQETAEEKWKNISSMNSAVLLCGDQVMKTYGKKAYINELIGWYVLQDSLPAESKNKLVMEDLDDI